MYDPYAHLKSHWPHITLITHHKLPGDIAGQWWGDHTIYLCRLLTSAERRATLAHEIVHMERGDTCLSHRVYSARQELAVDKIAARRLITIEDLSAVMTEGIETRAAAERLQVDEPMLTTRLQHLTSAERTYLNERAHQAA